MLPVGLKICGVTRLEDLEACAAAGVPYVGINFWPLSRRGLSLDAASSLLAAWPLRQRGRTKIVGVLVDHPPAFVHEATQRCGLAAAQLHGDENLDAYADLEVPLVWVIRGTPELTSLPWPKRDPAWILLDALVAGFGGMGAQTDWVWARRFVAAFAHRSPIWLAGGITADNAHSAILQVQPAGLDVASGAEQTDARHGEKDLEKIRQLMAAIQG